jgi:hypothetical protein
MLVHIRVSLAGHHVHKRLPRRIANDENGVPPRAEALTDHQCLRSAGVDRSRADSLQVRLDLAGVALVMLNPVGLIELEQVDHRDWLVLGDLRKLLQLLCCGF